MRRQIQNEQLVQDGEVVRIYMSDRTVFLEQRRQRESRSFAEIRKYQRVMGAHTHRWVTKQVIRRNVQKHER
jgi:hypothetical protein